MLEINNVMTETPTRLMDVLQYVLYNLYLLAQVNQVYVHIPVHQFVEMEEFRELKNVTMEIL